MILMRFREMLENEDSNLAVVLTHTIYNELSSAKHPNNMQIIYTAFLCDPDRTPKVANTCIL